MTQKINMHKEFSGILAHNKDGSHSTQASRRATLHQIADDLKKLGFFNLSVHGLKPKHIEKIINHWKAQNLREGTIKNRMSHLRWLSQKINKPAIVARSNSHYGIANRTYVNNISKAKHIENSVIGQVKDERLKYSFLLQQEFGLRREEAIKFQPKFAIDHGKPGFIRLKASWCKGGRERYIPIKNQRQQDLVRELVHQFPLTSLIPLDKSYVDQLRLYEGECKRLGLMKLHGLRHAYAQSRYFEITGWKAPADGGPCRQELSTQQNDTDHRARMVISQELGHGREGITAVYLGR
jgi:integrase